MPSPAVKVLFEERSPMASKAYHAVRGDDIFPAVKPEETSADFLCSEERNHTTDDRDPSQRWEE
ncbi:hypothetical protein [Phyllobacterium myrsinacearum]|uniref:Uncharacterized protein n=1 Tax=Phyllobacterium myrsinacearum TaxID=28101 RepID=A0A839EMD1_9HYPH|nr:hypothetical protein [Phyllobacterium myrsinacearum]MBA8879989.1 hypothetical protein [Phyllobacterium myrsinacearum]